MIEGLSDNYEPAAVILGLDDFEMILKTMVEAAYVPFSHPVAPTIYGMRVITDPDMPEGEIKVLYSKSN